MEIVEHFIQGKRPDPSLCEDGWVCTPHFAAVVDGSTSKVAGRHGGREAMLLITEALKSLMPEADKGEMLRHLTAALSRHNPPKARRAAEYRLTCSAAIFSRARRVVWIVGDCQCRIGGKIFTNPKRTDAILAQVRGDVLRFLLSKGHTIGELRKHDLGREFIHGMLREQTNFQNDTNPRNPFRYAVLDGTPPIEEFVKEIPVPQEAAELVLASDGYPQPAATLRESEELLRQLLHEDPLCMARNAGTKAWAAGNASYDDRCYLRLRL